MSITYTFSYDIRVKMSVHVEHNSDIGMMKLDDSGLWLYSTSQDEGEILGRIVTLGTPNFNGSSVNYLIDTDDGSRLEASIALGMCRF